MTPSRLVILLATESGSEEIASEITSISNKDVDSVPILTRRSPLRVHKALQNATQRATQRATESGTQSASHRVVSRADHRALAALSKPSLMIRQDGCRQGTDRARSCYIHTIFSHLPLSQTGGING